MTASMPSPPRRDWATLPMHTAMVTFWPPTEDRMRFMKQIGIGDTIFRAPTFPAPYVCCLGPGCKLTRVAAGHFS